jgi:hypothetical protein
MRFRGNLWRVIRQTNDRAIAPATSRESTTCTGDNPCKLTLTKKKLDPHVNANRAYCNSTVLFTMPLAHSDRSSDYPVDRMKIALAETGQRAEPNGYLESR